MDDNERLVALNADERELLRDLLQKYGSEIYWDEDLEKKGFTYEDFLDAVDQASKLFKKLT